jgi:hypothetical protein
MPPNIASGDYPLRAEAELLPSRAMHANWLRVHAPAPCKTLGASAGKWCIFRPSRGIDAAWAIVDAAVRQGYLEEAKVSTALALPGRSQHVICVYTRDWSNLADVQFRREYLRELGFVEELSYKRNMDTSAGIYGTPDEWLLRA